MEAIAITKNVRMSPRKVREVTRQIQGLNAQHAQSVLEQVTRKSARLVGKTLKSAMANAENIGAEKEIDVKTELLKVKEAVVGDAPTMKRFIPKARGSAGPILKRSCHIRIIVSDE